MLTWSHYAFRELLLHKAKGYPHCRVVICTEEWTSKTCSCCGTLHHALGKAETFHCPNVLCKAVMHRDTNAARNILLKVLGEAYQKLVAVQPEQFSPAALKQRAINFHATQCGAAASQAVVQRLLRAQQQGLPSPLEHLAEPLQQLGASLLAQAQQQPQPPPLLAPAALSSLETAAQYHWHWYDELAAQQFAAQQAAVWFQQLEQEGQGVVYPPWPPVMPPQPAPPPPHEADDPEMQQLAAQMHDD
jgi:hypothetical protein